MDARANLSVQFATGRGLRAVNAAARSDVDRAYRTTSGGRRILSATFQSIVATGTVYPSYAGNQSVTASTTQNTTSLPSSITLNFSNVPVGNNEWVVVDVVAYDQANGTGSHVNLGQLAGFVNVNGATASASIDAAATMDETRLS